MNYDAFASIAKDMLKDSGANVTYTRNTKAEYEPATRSHGSETEEEYTVKALVTLYRTSEIDGTNIIRGDKKILIAANSMTITPKSGDTITDIDGNKYKVISFENLKPGDTAIIYKIQVRS